MSREHVLLSKDMSYDGRRTCLTIMDLEQIGRSFDPWPLVIPWGILWRPPSFPLRVLSFLTARCKACSPHPTCPDRIELHPVLLRLSDCIMCTFVTTLAVLCSKYTKVFTNWIVSSVRRRKSSLVIGDELCFLWRWWWNETRSHF